MPKLIGWLAISCLAFLLPSGASVGHSSHTKPQPGAKTKPAKLDSFGDPLPDGVFYRLGTVRLRHQHTTAMMFSADGSQLLSQGGTPDLRLWDVATGKIMQQFAEAPEGRNHLIASPDDRYLVFIRGNSYQMLLLDKATGKELGRSQSPTDCILVAFSRDSKNLVALTREHSIVRWDTTARKEIARVKLDISKVDLKSFGHHCWHLAPNGATVAFMPGVEKGAPRLPWHFWDTTTGKPCRPPLKTTLSPSQMCWSPDGIRVAVFGSDNTVQVWDTVAGKRLPVEAGNRQKEGSSYTSRGVVFHPDGKLLAIAIDGTVGVWDVEAGKRLWGKGMSGDLLAFNPDGKMLAVGGDRILLVETATGEAIGVSRRDPGWIGLVGSHSFLSDSRSFAAYDSTGMSLFETATGKRLHSYYTRKLGWFATGWLSDQTDRFACRGADEHGVGHIFMLEAATGKDLWRRRQQPSALYFTPDGKTLGAMSWEQDVLAMLDAATGREIKKVSVPSYKNTSSTSTALSDDLGTIATSQNLHKIDLWDLDTGKKLRTLEGPEGHGAMYFVPGSKLFVAAPERHYHDRKEKRVWTRFWNVATGQIVRSFDDPLEKVSADGRWLVMQGDVQSPRPPVIIRHWQTGRLVATLDGLSPDANWRFLEISADGSLVAGRSESWHEVGLWDTFTGRQVCRFVEPLSSFQSAAFSPDSRTLVLTVRDGGSMLVCDVTGRATEPGKIPPQILTDAEIDRRWMELISDDGPRSRRARWSLVAGGEHTVKMLERVLRRVEPPDAKHLSALIAALDSGSFAERQKSTLVLEKMELARPALEESLLRNPSVEMRRRIESILAKQDAPSWSDDLKRAMRGVLLLEQIATPPARQLLRTLASGAPGSLLTQEAQAAMQRLKLGGASPFR